MPWGSKIALDYPMQAADEELLVDSFKNEWKKGN